MKIERNESTQGFLNKLKAALNDNKTLSSIQNSVQGRYLSKEDETIYKRKYRDLFGKNPILKGNPKIITNNDYFKNISLKEICIDNIEFYNNNLPARTCLFNTFPTISDGFGHQTCTMSYYDKNINIPTLKENGHVWMSITEMEITSMEKEIERANGKCCTMGLGLGYYTYMCSLKDTVDSITVIEFNPLVIKVFKEYILPQFKHKDKITIIEGNMYDYLNNTFLSQYDTVFIDTWQNDDDGVEQYKKIHKCDIQQCYDKIGYWIEDTITMPYSMWIGLYIKDCLEDSLKVSVESMKYNHIDQKEYLGVIKYFDSIDKVITTSEELEEILLSKKIIREMIKYM